MKKIESFTVNHIDLLRGIYVSRKDYVSTEIITTFDIRMKQPNKEPVMNTAEMHAIEHLAATYLRNHADYSTNIIYFGPMGCRTGFYLLIKNVESSKDIVPLITDLFKFIVDFNDEIPGATARDCGNYLDMNLPMAKYEAKKFLEEVLENIKDCSLHYPKS